MEPTVLTPVPNGLSEIFVVNIFLMVAIAFREIYEGACNRKTEWLKIK